MVWLLFFALQILLLPLARSSPASCSGADLEAALRNAENLERFSICENTPSTAACEMMEFIKSEGAQEIGTEIAGRIANAAQKSAFLNEYNLIFTREVQASVQSKMQRVPDWKNYDDIAERLWEDSRKNTPVFSVNESKARRSAIIVEIETQNRQLARLAQAQASQLTARGTNPLALIERAVRIPPNPEMLRIASLIAELSDEKAILETAIRKNISIKKPLLYTDSVRTPKPGGGHTWAHPRFNLSELPYSKSPESVKSVFRVVGFQAHVNSTVNLGGKAVLGGRILNMDGLRLTPENMQLKLTERAGLLGKIYGRGAAGRIGALAFVKTASSRAASIGATGLSASLRFLGNFWVTAAQLALTSNPAGCGSDTFYSSKNADCKVIYDTNGKLRLFLEMSPGKRREAIAQGNMTCSYLENVRKHVMPKLTFNGLTCDSGRATVEVYEETGKRYRATFDDRGQMFFNNADNGYTVAQRATVQAGAFTAQTPLAASYIRTARRYYTSAKNCCKDRADTQAWSACRTAFDKGRSNPSNSLGQPTFRIGPQIPQPERKTTTDTLLLR